MATTGSFPASHTTTTTTTTRVVVAPCKFDPLYIRTIPGILKIIQLVADLLGFICIMTVNHWYPSAVNWYSFVAMTGFWVTGTLLVFYLFHLIERLHMLPWMLIEFIYCVVWCVFFLIAGSVAASKAAYSEGFGAASFFGYCGMVVYGYDAFLKFRGWRAGEIAQGERIVATSTTTSPAY